MVTLRIPFEEYIAQEARGMADRCTACGKCLEVCPIVDYTPYKDRERDALMALARGVLKDGVYSEEANVVAAACNGSADCLEVCPEGINPMRMLRLVRSRAQKLLIEAGQAAGRGGAAAQTHSMLDVVRSLQLRDSEINWYQGAIPEGVQADIVLMLGCNIMRTPHLAHAGVEVLRRIGLDVQAIGGRAYCCGSGGFGTDNQMSQQTTLGTYGAFAKFSPQQVLTWCPSCYHHFNDFTDQIIDTDFEIDHTTHFLMEHLDGLQQAIVRPIHKRVALHEHGALSSKTPVVSDVKKVLSLIPGLELVEIEQFHYGYQCGSILSANPPAPGADPASKRVALKKVCEEAAKAGVDMLVTIHQSCDRVFCTAEKSYPFEAKSLVMLLAEAMGMEYENRYKKYKLLGNVDDILWEARELVADSGYPLERIKQAIQWEWIRPDDLSPERLSSVAEPQASVSKENE